MSPRTPPWKVVVIVEDDSDGRAIVELASRSGLGAEFDWLPAGGIGNIKRNADRLIALAQDRVAGGRGCVAVVVDRDGKDPSRDEPHRTIAQACRRLQTEFIAAREAIEAWFLADPGVCDWLGVKTLPASDHIPNPKRRVAQAFEKKTGRPYRRRRARLEVARHSGGIEHRRNTSARRALAAVRECIKRGQQEIV